MMLKAPFPYFGGKSAVAANVWTALGQPKHYIEPFFGSGAVLLLRPRHDRTKHIETVNDKDGYICNVWRALQADPDEVAKYCDWPVNHADLSARKKVLIANEDMLLENLISKEKWYDPVMAGYWIWAASCWIGSGLTCIGGRPHIGTGGMGVHAIGQRPHISNGGMGVHAIGKIPHIATGGMGVQGPYNTNIYQWFRQLSERLRYVRVVCGDWKRVCGGNWQNKLGDCGIFFDPPYGVKDRDLSLYHHDSMEIAQEVMEWCRDRGADKTYRIVIAGYDEYTSLIKEGWTTYSWKAQGGYANVSRNGKQDNQGKINCHREMLYFSPYCIKDNKKIISRRKQLLMAGICNEETYQEQRVV